MLTASTPRAGRARGATRRRAAPRSASSRSAARIMCGDPGATQRPELWKPVQYPDPPGRVGGGCFPLSNWTEVDVWSYIAAEDIPVVPLYFRQGPPPPWCIGSGALIMVDDERLPLEPGGDAADCALCGFARLGCYPAVRPAVEVRRGRMFPAIVAEMPGLNQVPSAKEG